MIAISNIHAFENPKYAVKCDGIENVAENTGNQFHDVRVVSHYFRVLNNLR